MERKLSDQQRRFAQGVVSGMTQEEAYTAAGYKATGNACAVNASRLLRNAKLQDHLEGLRAKSRSNAVLTAQELKEALTRMIIKAESKEDSTGFSGLTDRLCKMEGFYTAEKHEVQVNDLRQIIAESRAKNTK